MKKILFIIIIVIFSSVSCCGEVKPEEVKRLLEDYCGAKIIHKRTRKAFHLSPRVDYLYLEESGNPDLIKIEVDSDLYDFYSEGDTITCTN